jgi:hypothetical protein
MNPITHFLVSWTLADSVSLADRDRKLAETFVDTIRGWKKFM